MLEEKILSFRGRRAKVLGHEHTPKSAVIVPLIREKQELYVVLEKRAATLNRQPGEICFPGGLPEPEDRSTQAIAIRETCEELGLTPEDIEMIAPLDVMVHPFSSIIVPFLAFIKDHKQIHLNPSEVERLLFVPLSYLLKTKPLVHNITMQPVLGEDFPFELIPYGRDYPFGSANYIQYFYKWEEEVIWGLTSRILHHFIELLKNGSRRTGRVEQ